MLTSPDRRAFLAASTSALLAAGAAAQPNEKIHVAILGVRGRGKDLLREFAACDDVEIAYLCDPDLNVVPAALKVLPSRHSRQPKVVQDLRLVLEDKSVDAVVVATPDHWHALATVWACQADKHVYVEKPISHNLIEGRRMVEAARRYKRVVQVGTQRRSSLTLQQAAEFIKGGGLGKIPFARAWIAGHRKTIGKKADAPVPAKVDYNLWLGPAPTRPFNPNRFHYEWHWFWDYGTGELGNNGIHGLDTIRMLTGLDGPTRISAGGGRYFDDDRETPDTHIATFDFLGGTTVVWEHRIWAKTGLRNKSFGIELVGEKATLFSDGSSWSIDGEPEDKTRKAAGVSHVRNFLDCIKSGNRPNADIEEGHKSTRLCHLGNIAYRLGRTLSFDPATETIAGDTEASALLGRTYRKGFELPNKV